jgi:uncharacterized protein (TIGR03086 family)
MTTDQLADALDRFGVLVAGVRDEQWALPTPCPDWDVRALVTHVINGNLQVASALAGETSPLAGYAGSAAAVLAAFRAPGALERIAMVPFGAVPGAVALHLRLTELLVHGWDLARATGQATDFPAGLAEQELAFTLRTLPSVPKDRSPFGPSQPAADDATALDRLAACLGRDVR